MAEQSASGQVEIVIDGLLVGHAFTEAGLAEHDRQVAEKAWDEGRNHYGVTDDNHPLNPYRKQASNDAIPGGNHVR